MGRLLAAGLVALAALGVPGTSMAAWSQPGSGSQSARALTMPAGATPTAASASGNVTVSWAQRTIGGTPVAGHVVRRYDSSGQVQTIGAGCTGTIAGLSCTESSVPDGIWTYTVEPRHHNWIGTESSASAPVKVGTSTLTFSSSTDVASLPATLSGTVSLFTPGQTVTYRLDNPSTGTVLSGSITPSPIPANGSASVSVIVPAGTSAGAHTVYAVGSGGDTAGAGITVLSTVTTSAWDVDDASTGSLSNDSQPEAIASDGRTADTGSWSSSYSSSRWIEFDMNAPLPTGTTVTGATFNFRRAATQSGETACYYFEVRRISTGAVLATHGSSGSSVSCTSSTSLSTVTTSIPSISTSDLANDVRIRVYGRHSNSQPMEIDMATVSGSAASTAFTLYPTRINDAADSTASASPWELATEDATPFLPDAEWSSSFSSSRYLSLKFPAYIPASATMKSATLKHVFRPDSSTNSACWYAEVRSGGSTIGTHGSSGSPISCRTGSSYSTDTVSLPEVNTVARANDLTVRMYVWVTGGSSNRATEHDQAQVTLNYAP